MPPSKRNWKRRLQKMLEVCRKKDRIRREAPEPCEIIITKFETVTEYGTEGEEIKRRLPKKVNITRKINETKKLLKTYTAEEKVKEIEKIFSK